jgi:hypothetical protein
MYAKLKKYVCKTKIKYIYKLKTKKCKCHFYATVILLYEHNF